MAKIKVTEKGKEDIILDLERSNETGMHWKIPKGHDGLHFKSKESVQKYAEKKYPDAEITITS